MQSEAGFPSSHKLKSYVASKSRLKLAARAVLSADAGLLVTFGGCYLCANFGENRSENATVIVRTDRRTHTLTDTN